MIIAVARQSSDMKVLFRSVLSTLGVMSSMCSWSEILVRISWIVRIVSQSHWAPVSVWACCTEHITANMAASFPGVLNGQISEYCLENVKEKWVERISGVVVWGDDDESAGSRCCCSTLATGQPSPRPFSPPSPPWQEAWAGETAWCTESPRTPSAPTRTGSAPPTPTRPSPSSQTRPASWPPGAASTSLQRRGSSRWRLSGRPVGLSSSPTTRPSCWSWSTPASARRSSSPTPRTGWTCWSRMFKKVISFFYNQTSPLFICIYLFPPSPLLHPHHRHLPFSHSYNSNP